MRYVLYAIAVWLAFGGVVTVTQVGKARKPLSGGTAATSVAIAALIVVALVVAAGELPQ